MPLTLHEPDPERSKNWRIRGSYLGNAIDQSARTPDRRLAGLVLRNLEQDIERGLFVSGKSFKVAAAAYVNGGGEPRFLTPLIKHFRNTPIHRINQIAIDEAAAELYPPGISHKPSGHNGTINRQVHTPVRAVLAANGIEIKLRRPKQAAGRVRWLQPEEATSLIQAASTDLRPLIIFLLYTGCRIGEACRLHWLQIELDRRTAYLPTTKNGHPRLVHLPPPVMTEISKIEHRKGRVFAYPNRHRVYEDWHAACQSVGLEDFRPHDLCHTWATWMRRYGGLDTRGLIGTDRWRSRQAVERYVHVVPGEDAMAADLLPDVLMERKEGCSPGGYNDIGG